MRKCCAEAGRFAWRYLLEQNADHGDPHPRRAWRVLAGDSAGGHLTTSAAGNLAAIVDG